MEEDNFPAWMNVCSFPWKYKVEFNSSSLPHSSTIPQSLLSPLHSSVHLSSALQWKQALAFLQNSLMLIYLKIRYRSALGRILQ